MPQSDIFRLTGYSCYRWTMWDNAVSFSGIAARRHPPLRNEISDTTSDIPPSAARKGKDGGETGDHRSLIADWVGPAVPQLHSVPAQAAEISQDLVASWNRGTWSSEEQAPRRIILDRLSTIRGPSWIVEGFRPSALLPLGHLTDLDQSVPPSATGPPHDVRLATSFRWVPSARVDLQLRHDILSSSLVALLSLQLLAPLIEPAAQDMVQVSGTRTDRPYSSRPLEAGTRKG